MAHSSTNPRSKLEKIFSDSLSQLEDNTDASRYVVAYSGGVDSRVLLQLCVDLGLTVRAIHINHQLQPEADSWAQQAIDTCQRLGVNIEAVRVDAAAGSRESPEAVAREARYPALLEAMHEGEILLLAQHADDQAETVLIQMMRGAGPAGLSAMPVVSERLNAAGQRMTLMRPLLEATREQIVGFATERALEWVEDPSNQDTDIRRNAVRHRVMPLLEEIAPRSGMAFARVASQQQISAELLDDLARIDLAQCVGESEHCLQLSRVGALSESRQFNLIRYWLHKLGTRPNRAAIQQIQSDVLHASNSADPCVRWGDHQVRREDDRMRVSELSQA